MIEEVSETECASFGMRLSRRAMAPSCGQTFSGQWTEVQVLTQDPSYGPYAKGMSFEKSRPFARQRLIEAHPAAMAVTSNKYQGWELLDPENWVRDGYAYSRVDARGAGAITR